MTLHFFPNFGGGVRAAVIQADVLTEPPFPMQLVHQVHGTDILEVEKMEAVEAGYDAMVTRQPGVKLCIKTADCIPAVFADESAGIVAAAHAGWRGLVADILPKTVAKMVEMGADPSRLRVGLGPSLGTECAEFSDPPTEIPPQYHWAIQANKHVDLNGIALRQLLDAGIPEANIHRMDICTCCNSTWPSWRREQSSERMGTVIWLDV